MISQNFKSLVESVKFVLESAGTPPGDPPQDPPVPTPTIPDKVKQDTDEIHKTLRRHNFPEGVNPPTEISDRGLMEWFLGLGVFQQAALMGWFMGNLSDAAREFIMQRIQEAKDGSVANYSDLFRQLLNTREFWSQDGTLNPNHPFWPGEDGPFVPGGPSYWPPQLVQRQQNPSTGP